MGTQFWWFFDAAVIAVILVAVFIAGKKGLAKTAVVMVGCLVSIILGFSLSGTLSNFVYRTAIEQSNIIKIQKALSSNDLSQKTKIYIEGLGYNVRVDDSKLSDIFIKEGNLNEELYKYLNNINGRTVDKKEDFNEKMTTGFAEIFDTILSDGLSKFAGEVAYKKITADSGKLAEMVTLIENDSRTVDETGYKASAEFIEKNFTADAYKEMMKTIALVVISVIALLLLLNIARKFNNGAPENKMGDISDHIIGGFFGIIEGLSIVVLMTAVVRLMIIYGSNEMILFNKECIDKTFIFKHIYNLVTSL